MTIIIFLMGMLVASVFAILVYGHLGTPPSHEKMWVDYYFWGIVIVSLVPLAIETASITLREFKRRLSKHVSNLQALAGKWANYPRKIHH